MTKYRIREPVLNRWDVVDAGDNPGAKILLFKNQGGLNDNKVDNANNSTRKGDEDTMTLQEILEKMSKGEALNQEEQDFIKSDLDAKANELDVLKEDNEAKASQIDEIQKKLTNVESELTKLKKDKPEEDSKPEDILKKADPKVQEQFQKMKERLEKAEQTNSATVEKLQKMEDDRQREKMLTKAKSLEGIEGTPEDLADLLHKIAKAAPEDFGKLEEILEGLNKKIVESDLFKTVGSSEEGVGKDNEQKIAKKVAELRKDKPELTYEQAYDEVLNDNPDLYPTEE